MSDRPKGNPGEDVRGSTRNIAVNRSIDSTTTKDVSWKAHLLGLFGKNTAGDSQENVPRGEKQLDPTSNQAENKQATQQDVPFNGHEGWDAYRQNGYRQDLELVWEEMRELQQQRKWAILLHSTRMGIVDSFVTDKGNVINCTIPTNESTMSEYEYFRGAGLKYLRKAVLSGQAKKIDEPGRAYNSSGFTFAGGAGCISEQDVQRILDDNRYRVTSKAQPGDIIVYRSPVTHEITHTGIVTETASLPNKTIQAARVVSKWGEMSLYSHAPSISPPEYGTWQIYHSDRPGGSLLTPGLLAEPQTTQQDVLPYGQEESSAYLQGLEFAWKWVRELHQQGEYARLPLYVEGVTDSFVTDAGNEIKCTVRPEGPLAEEQNLQNLRAEEQYLQKAARKVKKLGEAGPEYNSHGFTFAGGAGCISEQDVQRIFDDNPHRIALNPQRGDIIVYRSPVTHEITHTSIVEEVKKSLLDGKRQVTRVVSKWGAMLCSHAPGDCPPEYGDWQVYHSDRPDGSLLTPSLLAEPQAKNEQE